MAPRSIQSRLLFAFLFPAAGFFVGVGVSGYFVFRKNLEAELDQGLVALARAAASQVSGERLLSIAPGDDREETRTFRGLHRLLDEVRQSAGLRRVVAFDLEGRVRVDAGGGLPVGAEFPERLQDRLELGRVARNEAAASQVLFEGADGRFYKTGYAPVRDGETVVGVLGVEGGTDSFRPLVRLFRLFVVLTLGFLVALFGVALVTARSLAAPLGRLMEAALRIGRGDLSTRVPSEVGLEIGTLAHELEAMRSSLESRDRQLKMMLAGIAHEVKNPLGGIELFTGLLAEELPQTQEGASSHLRRIQKELDYLKRVVDDFLAFAREEKVGRGPVSVLAWLESARELVEADGRRKGVRIDLAAEPATLQGDESLLGAALVNVLKNAIQASPEGGQVALSGAVRGDRYEVSVEDRGPGIPVAVQESVFEPFFTTREKGTGLGLPLSRKIVQAHGGTLHFESVPGKTVFRFELPL